MQPYSQLYHARPSTAPACTGGTGATAAAAAGVKDPFPEYFDWRWKMFPILLSGI